jgi:Co/Zn/Cd efflux system component
MKHTLTLFALLWAVAAQAHDGHGLQGAHWHATDVAGFVVAVVAAAAFLWWRGRK